MAIVAAEPWDFTVFKKKEDSQELIIERTEQLRIDKRASVRKLFRETRRKFGARTAVRLFRVTLSIHPVTKKQQIATENEITKNDNQICNTISNGASLRIQIHPSNREVYTIFVTLPNGANKTFLLEEQENTEKLYQTVRQQLNGDQKIFKLKYGSDETISENTTDVLYSSIFDGIQLKVCINPKKLTLTVMLPQKPTTTINIPEDATVLDLYREVESRLPNKEGLRLSIANTELCKNTHGAHLVNQHAKHTSTVVLLWRNRGGSDRSSQVQMLHNKTLTSCELPCCCWCEEETWSCSVRMLRDGQILLHYRFV